MEKRIENLQKRKLSKANFRRRNWNIMGQYNFNKQPIYPGVNNVSSTEQTVGKTFRNFGTNWVKMFNPENSPLVAWNFCVNRGQYQLCIFDQIVLISKDFGNTWTTLDIFKSFTSGDIRGSTIALIETNGTLHITTDEGSHWTVIESIVTNAKNCKLTISPNEERIAFLMLPNFGFYVYEHSEITQYVPSLEFNDICFSTNNLIYLTSDKFIYRYQTDNEGVIYFGNEISGLSVYNNKIIAISNNSVLYSENETDWIQYFFKSKPKFLSCGSDYSVLSFNEEILITNDFVSFINLPVTEDLFKYVPVIPGIYSNYLTLWTPYAIYVSTNFTDFSQKFSLPFFDIFGFIFSITFKKYSIAKNGNYLVSVRNSQVYVGEKKISNLLPPFQETVCAISSSGRSVVVISQIMMAISIDSGETWLTIPFYRDNIKFCQIFDEGFIIAISNTKVYKFNFKGTLIKSNEFTTQSLIFVYYCIAENSFIVTKNRIYYSSNYGLSIDFQFETGDDITAAFYNDGKFYYITYQQLYTVTNFTENSGYQTVPTTLDLSVPLTNLICSPTSVYVGNKEGYFLNGDRSVYKVEGNASTTGYVPAGCTATGTDVANFVLSNTDVYEVGEENTFVALEKLNDNQYKNIAISKISMCSSGKIQTIVTPLGGILVSQNRGKTWFRPVLMSSFFYIFNSISGTGKYHIAVTINLPTQLFSVVISDDYGTTFNKLVIDNFPSEMGWISSACSFTGQVMSILSLEGFFGVSLDFGKTWTFTNLKEQFNIPNIFIITMKQAIMTPDGKIHRAISISGHILESLDYGKTWVLKHHLNMMLFFIAMSEDGKYVTITALTGQFFVSSDSLETLNQKGRLFTGTISSVAMSANGQYQMVNSGQLFLSSDFGENFDLVQNMTGTFCLTIAANSSGSLFKTITFDGFIIECNNREVFGQDYSVTPSSRTSVLADERDMYSFSCNEEIEFFLPTNKETRTIIVNQYFELSEKMGVSIKSKGDPILFGGRLTNQINLYAYSRTANLRYTGSYWICQSGLPYFQIPNSYDFNSYYYTTGSTYLQTKLVNSLQGNFTISFTIDLESNIDAPVFDFGNFKLKNYNNCLVLERDGRTLTSDDLSGQGIYKTIVINREGGKIQMYSNKEIVANDEEGWDFEVGKDLSFFKGSESPINIAFYFLKISTQVFTNLETQKYDVDAFTISLLDFQDSDDMLFDCTRLQRYIEL